MFVNLEVGGFCRTVFNKIMFQEIAELVKIPRSLATDISMCLQLAKLVMLKLVEVKCTNVGN